MLTNSLDFFDVAVARRGRFPEQARTRVGGTGRRLRKREVLDRQQECLCGRIGQVRLLSVSIATQRCGLPQSNGGRYVC